MLNVILNSGNFDDDFAAGCIGEFVEGPGISSSLDENVREYIAGKAKISVYETEIPFDSADDAAVGKVLADAEKYGAEKVIMSAGCCCDAGKDESEYYGKLESVKKAALNAHAELLVTNRRTFCRNVPVSAAKLARLSEKCGVKIAYDFGFAHAYGTALENLYDYMDNIGMILMNDNFGVNSNNVSRDWINNEIMYVDEKKQPGYGNAPFVGMADILRDERKDIPLYINGSRQGMADLPTVLIETKAILGGRVYVSPAFARIGRNEKGRIII